MRNPNIQHILRIVVGVYVAYLGYKILRDGIVGGGMEGNSRILGLVFSIIFIVVGVGLAILALRNLNRAREAEQERQEEEARAAAEAQELPEVRETMAKTDAAPQERSLFDKARVSANDPDEDAEE